MSRPNEALPLLNEALAPFQAWWADEAVEDILINRPGEAFVRRGAVTTRHDIPHDVVDLEAIAILAASLKRQNVGKARPLLSCDLPGGTRLQAVLPPCVEDGTVALAIRRARRTAPTLDDLGKGGIFAEISPSAGGMTEADRALLRLYRDAQAGPEGERQARYGAFLRAGAQDHHHVRAGGLGQDDLRHGADPGNPAGGPARFHPGR
jgi:type IV secretion system protein VirB11